MKKRLSIITGILLFAASLLLVNAVGIDHVYADEPQRDFYYVERSWNGTGVDYEQKSFQRTHPGVRYRLVNDLSDNGDVTLNEGWWYVERDKTFKNSRLKISGKVHLVLSPADLTCNKGIYVPKGAELTIYSENADVWEKNCRLYAKTEDGSAGAAIGGNNSSQGGKIIIKGGNITTSPGTWNAGIGGGNNASFEEITVFGGTLLARGGNGGAGIGNGGGFRGNSDSGKITIYGGEITARGSGGGAGIGGGNDGYNPEIHIWGGNINAEGSQGVIEHTFWFDDYSGSAGIGSGAFRGQARTVYIYGGNVTANGRVDSPGGAGIGGASEGQGGTVEIGGKPGLSPNVIAIGGSSSAGIGGGADGDNNNGNVILKSGTLEARSNLGYKRGMTSIVSAIGHGAGGSGDGKFSLPDNYKLEYKSPTGPSDRETTEFELADRSSRTSKVHEEVWIRATVCEHKDKYYEEIDAYKHSVKCKHCLQTFADESHIYKDDSAKCEKECGFEGLPVTLDPGWHGKGTVYTEMVRPGNYTLPECKFTGEGERYIFKYWVWVENGDIKEGRPGDVIEVNEERLIIAAWETSQYYRIRISGEITGGTVTHANYEDYYKEGATVKLTVTPEEGKALDSLKYIDEDGVEVQITKKTSANEYVFDMPPKDVTVFAVFSKHDHEWTFKNFSWTGDDESGYTAATAHYECALDSEHKDDRDATVTTEDVDPKCTTAGSTTYTAAVTAEDSPDGEAHSEDKVVPIGAIGHDWGDDSDWSEWHTEGGKDVRERTCKREGCDVIQKEEKNHVHDLYADSGSPASCTEEGTKPHLYCTKCPFWFDENDTEHPKNQDEFIIPASGHDWKTVTENEVPPTCETAGSRDEVSLCSVCNEKDESTRKNVPDPALGHEWGEWETTKYPTAVREGERKRSCQRDDCDKTETETLGMVSFTIKIEGFEQTNTFGQNIEVKLGLYDPDDNLLDHESKYYVGTEQYHAQVKFGSKGTILPLGANFTNGKATLTSLLLDGTEEGTDYSVRAYLQYVKGPSSYTKLGMTSDSITLITPKLTLTPSGCPEGEETTGKITVDGSQGQKLRYHLESENPYPPPHNAIEGTEIGGLKAGKYYVYTEASAADDGKTFYTRSYPSGQDKSQYFAEITGHDWTEPKYKVSDDQTEFTASRYCKKCEESEEETVSLITEVIEEPHCDVKGKAKITCDEFKNDAFEKQTDKEVDIPALGHDWTDWDEIRSATCTEKGEETHRCQRESCGKAETREIEARGHIWGEWKVVKKATTTQKGRKERICKRCSKKETEVIPKKKAVVKKPSGILIAKATASEKTALKYKWTKVNNVAGYDIFASKCNYKGKEYALKKVKTIKGNKTFTWTQKKLAKNTAYKAYVKAYVYKNGKKTYVRRSSTIHVCTGNSRKSLTNPKSISINKTSLKLSKGKTATLKGKVTKVKSVLVLPDEHAPRVRFLTTNKKVATVSTGGKVKAVGKGSCKIYVYAQNGLWKICKVTVK